MTKKGPGAPNKYEGGRSSRALSLSPLVGEWIDSLPKGERSGIVNKILEPHAREWKSSHPSNLRSLAAIRADIGARRVDAIKVDGSNVYWVAGSGEPKFLASTYPYEGSDLPCVVLEEGVLYPPPVYGDGSEWMDLVELLEEVIAEKLS